MPKKEYDWCIGESPPLIEEHTLIKHQIYQDYIIEYIKTLNSRPHIPSAKFVVVDAFAGGGLYKDKDNVEHQGSPIKIWEAMQAGEAAVNQSRDNLFTLNKKLFLLEKKKSNFDYLRHHLTSLEYDKWFEKEIIIQRGGFEEQYQAIIKNIQDTLGKNARTIFILDQYGYKDVTFASIRYIFEQLPRSEVILTLSVDDIIDYVSTKQPSKIVDLFNDTPPVPKNIAGLKSTLDFIGLDADYIIRLKEDITGNGWRTAIEHYITEELLLFTQAKHYAPFFLSRNNSHKSMWLIHLSNHAEATNVMKTIYHQYGNQDKTVISHYGRAGFDMLGYDDKKRFRDDYLFKDVDPYNFNEISQEKSHQQLLEDIPKYLRSLQGVQSRFDFLYDKKASDTPANKDMMRKAAQTLFLHKEIVIKNRKPRSNIKDDDILCLNPQKKIYFPK